MNTWVSFQSAEQPLLGQFSVSGNNLHTHDRRDYYAKRGWQVLGSFQAWGEEQWLMKQDL